MKNNIYIIIGVVLSLLSCDNFLDIKPVGKVIPKSYQDFREVMTFAYNTLPTDRSISTVRGDELILGEDWSKRHLHYKNIYLWNELNASGQDKEFPWQAFYKVILNANQVIINGTAPTGGTVEKIEQLRGEAFLMRAYMHLGLVNLFADVYESNKVNAKAIPLATTIDIWKDYHPNTLGEVYAQILSDIEEGMKLLHLEQQKKGFNYRFSKVSAYGFAARVYLYMGNWDKAREYAKKAYDINHELEDLNDAKSVLPVNYKSVENILAMEQSFHSDLGNFFFASDKMIAAFDKENDLRFAKYFQKKGANYKCILGFKADNKVSMRTAEFYLMLAETEVKSKTANLIKAKEYLKALLSKRLKPAYYTSEAAKIDAMTKGDFINRVEEERFRELACQGFRWYDLRRMGKPAITKTFEEKEYKLNAKDARYIVPFPKEAIENNPNLLNK